MAPGSVTDWITSTRNMMNSSGIMMVLAAAIPFLTPSAMTPMVRIHTTAMGMAIWGTKSKPTAGVSATWRKSPMRKAAGSSPQASVKLKKKYIAAQARMAA